MAAGRKTGGRDFDPEAARQAALRRAELRRERIDEIRQAIKTRGSVKALLKEFAENAPEEIYLAILEGIEAGPPHSAIYLQLMAAYVDGRAPDEAGAKQPQEIHITVTQVAARNTEHGLAVALPSAPAPALPAPDPNGEVEVEMPPRRAR